MPTGCICNECTNYGDDNACLSPLNLTFDVISETTMSLSWDAVPNANSYCVEFKELSAMSWNMNPAIVAPNTEDQIIGLTPDTEYEVRVQAMCDSTSCYTLTNRVKTLPLE